MLRESNYIVRLEQNADFTHELIQQAWGNSWGIFAITHKPATLIGVRRNCKKIAFVRDEETQKKMLFRYYDPRVLREFLPHGSCKQRSCKEYLPKKMMKNKIKLSMMYLCNNIANKQHA